VIVSPNISQSVQKNGKFEKYRQSKLFQQVSDLATDDTLQIFDNKRAMWRNVTYHDSTLYTGS